jgi:hypothetical protein
VVG